MGLSDQIAAGLGVESRAPQSQSPAQPSFVTPVDISPTDAKKTVAGNTWAMKNGLGALTSPVGNAAEAAYTKAQALKPTDNPAWDVYMRGQMQGLSSQELANQSAQKYDFLNSRTEEYRKNLNDAKSRLDTWDIDSMYNPGSDAYSPDAKRALQEEVIAYQKSLERAERRSNRAKEVSEIAGQLAAQEKDAQERQAKLAERYNATGSYSGVYDEANEALDKLKNLQSLYQSRYDAAKNGANYYGAAMTYERDKAKQEADIKKYGDLLTNITRAIDQQTKLRDDAGSLWDQDPDAQKFVAKGWNYEPQLLQAHRKAATDIVPGENGEAVEEFLPETYRQFMELHPKPREGWKKEQTDRYFYLLGKYGEDQAAAYAASVNTALHEAKNALDEKYVAEKGEGANSGFLARFGKSALGLAMQVSPAYPVSAAMELLNKFDSIYSTGYWTGKDGLTYRQAADAYAGGRANQLNKDYGTLPENIPVVGGKGAGDLYQLIPSAIKSYLYGGASEAATLSAFFIEAANSTFDEAYARTGNAEYAMNLCLLSGAAEVIGEKASLEHLLKPGFSWADVGTQMFIEGTEEVNTSLLKDFFDYCEGRARNERTAIQSRVDAYADGIGFESAEKKVLHEKAMEYAEDYLGGSITAGLSGSAQAATNSYVESQKSRALETLEKAAKANEEAKAQEKAQAEGTGPRNPLWERFRGAEKPAEPQPAATPQEAARRQETAAGQITQPQEQEAAQAVKPGESAQSESTNPLYNVASNPNGTSAQPVSKETAPAAEAEAKTAAPAQEEAPKTLEERRADHDRRYEDALERAKNPAPEEWDALNEELDALDAEENALKAEEVQQERVKNGEVSAGFGTAGNHIDNRTAKDAAKTNVKAFQFDHPELHPYYVEAAKQLMTETQAADVQTAVKAGQKGSAIRDGHVKWLMQLGMTKADIMKACQDIIDNNGAENYAKAKKVEIALNDMLSNGWTGQNREAHEANADYVATKGNIEGAKGNGTWEDYLAQHSFMLLDGSATEEQLRADWEQMRPAEESTAVNTDENIRSSNGEVLNLANNAQQVTSETPHRASAASNDTVPQSAPPVNGQTTAESTNGQGPLRERGMAHNLSENEKAEPELSKSFAEERDLYNQLTNKEVTDKADAILAKGYEAARNEVVKAVGKAQAGYKLAPEMALAGYHIANEMVRRGELEAARELCSDIAAELTAAGQVGQIGKLILAADPSIRIRTVDKIVDKMNEKLSNRQRKQITKRYGGAENAKTAKEAASEAMKTAINSFSNSMSASSDTFNFADEAAKQVAESIKAQVTNSNMPPKAKNALDTFVSYVKKFAKEKVDTGKKSKPMTSTELLREIVNNEDLFREVYEKAQAEFRENNSEDYLVFAENFLNTPAGIDGTGDARNKIFMRAIVESATETNENAETIRAQAALGVPHGEIAKRISDALIKATGATGAIADSIKGSAQAYVNKLIQNDQGSDTRIMRQVSAMMRNIGARFREIASKGQVTRDSIRQDIANMLALEYALSPESAEKIAESVSNEFDRQLSEAVQKELERRFAPKEKPAQDQVQQMSDKLMEAINLGAFDSEYAEQAVNKIFGVDGNIHVSDENLKRYAEAETDEDANAALEIIQQEIADQIPATFRDKFTALRYLNMLGNLKTQGRNILGNTAMMAATNFKYLTQHVMELAAAANGNYEVNTALNTSRELRQQAAEDYAAHADEIGGERKYSDVGREMQRGIKDKQKIFGTTGNALWDNTVGAGLEKARLWTNWAMEAGDTLFIRQIYIRSFAGWMKAHGISDVSMASPEQVSAARAFASKEAQEATFHDSNAVSDWVSQLGRGPNTPGVVRAIAEGVIPFRKTPANVAVRAVEYSPLGILEAVYKASQVKNGEASMADVINSAAKSATGTALFIAGLVASMAGKARASGDDDDKKLNAFQQMRGEMDYSVKLFGKNVSLSQFAPMAIPFFMGVKMDELLAYTDELSADNFMDILGVFTDPMLEMSMLSGVNDFLKDLSSINGDTDAIPSLVANAAAACDMVVAQFADVDQAVDSAFEFDERAEGGQLRDFAFDNVADLVLVLDRLPLHFEDDGFHFHALMQDFARVVHLADPGHVGDMDHAVDVVLNLDERAITGHVADDALDAGALRETFLDDLPRILLALTQAEGDLAVFLADFQNDGFDFVAFLQDVGSLVDFLRPGHFGNMDEAFDALFQFDERAVRHNVHDTALHAAAFRVLDVNGIPRIAVFLLQAQGNALAFLVHIQNHDFQFLADMDDFARMRNALPAHVRDMEQTVHAVQIDKRAELRDVLDDTAADGLRNQFVEKRRALLGAFGFQKFTAAQNDVATFRTDLQNLEFLFFAEEIVQIANSTQINLRARQERLHADIDDKATFHTALDRAFDQIAFLVILLDAVPRLLEFSLVQADGRDVLFVFHLFKIDFQHVASLDGVPFFAQLGFVDEGLRLEANVQKNAFVILLGHATVDDLVFIDVRVSALLQQILHGGHVF